MNDKFPAANIASFVSTISFLKPEDLSESAWLEHAAFAFWLIESLRPRTFVELGTYRGYSYFAICQAVKKLDIGTRCYAIDTWEGDDHTGHYGRTIYSEALRTNYKYSSFSSLIKSTFSDASNYFSDKSIDLLHVDGRHYYDDVKTDFETWQPKLTDNAIVLFHDVNVRERGFGVWRLFLELKERFPTFEFTHGYGLGVLAVGDIQEELQELFSADRQRANSIRLIYSRLGEQATSAWRCQEIEKRLAASTIEYQRVAEELRAATATNELLRHDLSEASDRLAVQSAANERLKLEQEFQDERLREQIAAKNDLLRARSVESERLSRQIAAAEALERDLQASRERLGAEIAAHGSLRRDFAAALAIALREREAAASKASDALSDLAVARREAEEEAATVTALRRELAERSRTLEIAGGAANDARTALDALTRTRAWRWTAPARKIHQILSDAVVSRRRRSVNRADLRIVARSRLFDRNWYLVRYPDVASAGIDPLRHYLAYGAAESRDPSPLFSTDWYLEQDPAVERDGINPFVHYLSIGAAQGRDPHPLFHTRWYLDEYPDVAAAKVNPLRHYVFHGAAEGRDPNPLFDSDWYLSQYPEVARAQLNPLAHFIAYGAAEGRDPNPVFDSDWYVKQYPDVARGGVNPLVHYIVAGAAEGCNPSPVFDSDWYRKNRPNVAETEIGPLVHYLRYGRAEGYAVHDPKTVLDGIKVAVVLHLFYADVWNEMAAWLRNIPVPFDLYATVPRDDSAALRQMVESEYPDARIVEVPNSGRDVGPFISLLPSLQAGRYTAICKLHTKKGRAQPATWRRLVLEGLLANQILVSQILHAFKTDPSLLFVGRREAYLSGPRFIMENARLVDELGRRLHPGKKVPEKWGFFAGTMFWVRPQALSKLSSVLADQITFEGDNEANDGQAAHALERVFGLIATLEQGHIGLTSVRGRGPWEPRLDILPAPGDPFEGNFQSVLRSHSADLPKRTPIARRPARRTWRPEAGALPGVNLIGPVESVHGLGKSARGYVSGLSSIDMPLNVVPWRQGFERVDRIAVDYPSLPWQPINLVHLNFDILAQDRLMEAGQLPQIATDDRYNVAVVYWELASLLSEWSAIIDRFDEFWCASSFIARSIAAVSPRPVRIVRPALDLFPSSAAAMRRHFALPENRFIFFYSADAGSVLGRKNPKALVDAYVEEFGPDEGACLLIKIQYGNRESPEIREIISLAERRSDVVFMDRLLSEGEMGDLFGLIDTYVSPHRSEGLGLTILEAMGAGKPVIATPYGGVSDFVSPATALPLDYRLIEVGDGNHPYPPSFVWADPSAASLRLAMRSLFSDRALAQELGRKGEERVRELFSPARTALVMRSEIDRIWRAA